MFTPEEQDILNYLKPLGKQFATAKEICRRAAGKERFSEDPDWAKRPLKRMEKKEILETNALGHFRIKVHEAKSKYKVPLDPRIRQILLSSGKDFSQVFLLKDDEDNADSGGQSKPAKK